MAGVTISSFSGALKQIYTDDKIENLTYEDNPFLAAVEKYEEFGGLNLPIPIIYGDPQGRAAKFATAQANESAVGLGQFLLTRVSDYGVATVSNEAVLASVGHEESFLQAATTTIDGMFHQVARSLAIAMYGDGSGAIGMVASIASNTVTLANVNDITNFEVNQVLVASTSPTGAPRTGSMTISSVDRIAGTITCSGGTITGLAANDYLITSGDQYGVNVASTYAKISGLAAWLPFGATAIGPSDSFFSLNRSVDRTRLGGIYYDASAQPITEGLIDGIKFAAREGGHQDIGLINYSTWGTIDKALESRVRLDPIVAKDSEGDASFSFSAFTFMGPRGPIKLIPDVNCPSEYCYLLTSDTWKLYSLGRAPDIIDYDGLKVRAVPTSDDWEVRIAYYAQMGTRAPGKNAVVKVSTDSF